MDNETKRGLNLLCNGLADAIEAGYWFARDGRVYIVGRGEGPAIVRFPGHYDTKAAARRAVVAAWKTQQ